MEKKEKYIEYLSSLCEVLNKNNIRQYMNIYKGNPNIGYEKEYYDWQVNTADPSSTFLGGIYSYAPAFKFLKENGYLDNRMCQFCGETPINGEYTFKSSLSPNQIVNICKSCSDSGKRESMNHQNDSNGKCYIATACYGDYDAPEVIILRNYRDQVLKKKVLGRIFIGGYYFFSPGLAKLLFRNTKLNRFVRLNILNKLVILIKEKYQN